MTTSSKPKWLTALASAEPLNGVPKKQVSARILAPLAHSLESMAELLGKTPTKLLGEIIEAAIYDFSDRLRTERPDLMAEQDDIYHMVHGTDYEMSDTRWITPEKAVRGYGLKQPAEDLDPSVTKTVHEVFQACEAEGVRLVDADGNSEKAASA